MFQLIVAYISRRIIVMSMQTMEENTNRVESHTCLVMVQFFSVYLQLT